MNLAERNFLKATILSSVWGISLNCFPGLSARFLKFSRHHVETSLKCTTFGDLLKINCSYILISQLWSKHQQSVYYSINKLCFKLFRNWMHICSSWDIFTGRVQKNGDNRDCPVLGVENPDIISASLELKKLVCIKFNSNIYLSDISYEIFINEFHPFSIQFSSW